jgi:hypothetical protein
MPVAVAVHSIKIGNQLSLPLPPEEHEGHAQWAKNSSRLIYVKAQKP